MKIRLTVSLHEHELQALARIFPDLKCRKRSTKQLLRSSAVVACERIIDAVVDAGVAELRAVYNPKLSESEKRDYGEAISYLRAQGKTDTQIAAWLALQRARALMPKDRDLSAI